MNIKKKLYEIIAPLGVKTLMSLFPEYFAKEPLSPTDRYIEYPFVIKNLPKPPARILDVGCAGTFFPLLLAAFGYETYAVDIRVYSIINRIEHKNFKFVQEDIAKTSFKNDYFDAITAVSIIEHIGLSGRYGSKEDLSGDKSAIEEMKRIIKPEGEILLTVPFGKPRIFRPFQKVYDPESLRQTLGNLKVELQEYYKQDAHDDWYKCTKDDAQLEEPTIYRSALCLLKLVKSDA